MPVLPHIENSQLTGFFMREILTFNELKKYDIYQKARY